ncbi:MAG TPA: hypothetical protein VH593_10145 [Ktedonobacteraceae bacterium]|jgi:hypothetical protein
MDDINVDVIGLQATIQLLQQFYRSGVLRAEVGQTVFLRGPCIVQITISEGRVVACYVENKSKQRLPLGIETVLDMDGKEGPFAWRFVFQQENKKEPTPESTNPPQVSRRPTGSSLPVPSPRSRSQKLPYTGLQLTSSAVPRRIGDLDLSWLTTWSPQQKRILRMVYSMIDGRRTVAMIEKSVLSSNATVQEALVVLIAMQVITVDRKQ